MDPSQQPSIQIQNPGLYVHMLAVNKQCITAKKINLKINLLHSRHIAYCWFFMVISKMV